MIPKFELYQPAENYEPRIQQVPSEKFLSTTKKVECETISIKTAIVVEEGTPEIVIPKKIRKEIEKLLIEELKNSKQ